MLFYLEPLQITVSVSIAHHTEARKSVLQSRLGAWVGPHRLYFGRNRDTMLHHGVTSRETRSGNDGKSQRNSSDSQVDNVHVGRRCGVARAFHVRADVLRESRRRSRARGSLVLCRIRSRRWDWLGRRKKVESGDNSEVCAIWLVGRCWLSAFKERGGFPDSMRCVVVLYRCCFLVSQAGLGVSQKGRREVKGWLIDENPLT